MPNVFLGILCIRCNEYDIYLLWPVLQNIKHMALVVNGDEESLGKKSSCNSFLPNVFLTQPGADVFVEP